MDIETGTISDWKEEKGFGFISPSSGRKKLFFHINNYSYRHKRPVANLKVQYFTSNDKNGRPCAIDVAPIKGHKNRGKETKQKLFSLSLLVLFSATLCFLLATKKLPSEVVGLYVFMSVVTFLMYAKDKHAAECGKWRTPESTLHALSLLGGWPGAKIAQSFLRHKSQKVSFRITYWVTAVVNCGVLFWLVTSEGSKWLNGLLKNIIIG